MDTIKDARLNLRITSSLLTELKDYCRREGRSQTWVAEKAIRDFLEQNNNTKQETTHV